MLRRWLFPALYFAALVYHLAWVCGTNMLLLSRRDMYVLLLLGSIPYLLVLLIAYLVRRRKAKSAPDLPQNPGLPKPFGYLAIMCVLLFWMPDGMLGMEFLLLSAIGTALRWLIHGIVLLAKRRQARKAGANPSPVPPAETPSPMTETLPTETTKALPKRRPRRRKLYRAAWVLVLASSVALLLGMRLKPVAVPDAIAAFAARYPEAEPFASRYADEHNRQHDMSVESECAKASIPLFIQWDVRWGYNNYGGNYLGVNGCGPTCMAMVVCGLTGDTQWNPYAMACFADEQGYYVPGNGTGWDFMTKGARQFGLEAGKGEITRKYILENLSPSTPMICSMRPGDFTVGGHYIVLTGIDEEGNILLNDPNSPIRSAKAWDVDVLIPQIKGIWRYHK